jgi:hypothetical protein
MKTFHCETCGSLVFFDNVSCLKCGHQLGFFPETLTVVTLEKEANGLLKPVPPRQDGTAFRLCRNWQQHEACNWLIKANDPDSFCVSCRLNLVIPDLTAPGNLERWRHLEKAKRRLIYTLLQLRLPTEGPASDPALALRFKFLGDVAGQAPVLTGHDKGLITLNIAEADDAERERRRVNLHEPLRTLLGHFRHESGHFYWDRLVANSPLLEKWRALFGDETRNYSEALQTYYKEGPSADWPENFISAYASAHPWEDWAETWAHYFHMIDTIETAASFGLSLHPKHPAAKSMTADFQLKEHPSFDDLIARWIPLTCALNSLNRGMGLHDLYPFAVSNKAAEKMRFVHEVVHKPAL